MADEGREGPEMLDALGDRFLLLMAGLISGNLKRAAALAEEIRRRNGGSHPGIMSQTLIEEMAQAQALKNSLINLPSVVPGLGTIVSFSLVGVENFYLLDQSVALVLALCLIHEKDIENREAIEDFTVRIIGEVFGVTNQESGEDSRSITREYVSRLLPMKYFKRGVDRSMQRVLRRIVPMKSRSRLLPVGIGLGSSAVRAYDTIVHVGQAALRHLAMLPDAPPAISGH
ncbi:MAG: hypothetical protein M0R18_01770 [Deltaproteobacteria bacterium]|nr:hypothetical protein [Deltaproteobacteria bacterium]HPW69282.1 hypothetical protein [Deltaproteobacteria bacterium]